MRLADPPAAPALRPSYCGVADCLVWRAQVFDPLVIGLSHRNGLDRLSWTIPSSLNRFGEFQRRHLLREFPKRSHYFILSFHERY
jgi:hypothetical protein